MELETLEGKYPHFFTEFYYIVCHNNRVCFSTAHRLRGYYYTEQQLNEVISDFNKEVKYENLTKLFQKAKENINSINPVRIQKKNGEIYTTTMIKKEYYTLPKDKPTIACTMMVKNEHKRLHVSLESIIGAVDALCIFDTGSEDDTIEILEKFSEKHKINLYLIKGEFVDFSISRSVLLDFCDMIDIGYLLLMDCNDELRGKEQLKILCDKMYLEKCTGFLLTQRWFSQATDVYYNVRLVKNHWDWRFKQSVHEYPVDTGSDNGDPRFPVYKVTNSDIELFQDRTKDDDKSSKRFKRDRELLLREHIKDPTNARVCFYLAQTVECLAEFQEALFYSKLRIPMGGFMEEVFHSYMRCGNSMAGLGCDWHDVMPWYVKAYENFHRAEPLVKIADYYRMKASDPEQKEGRQYWRLAYMYIHEAVEIPFPSEAILFVDYGAYKYYRHLVAGIVCSHAGKYIEGKKHAEIALKNASEENRIVARAVVDFYNNFEKEHGPLRNIDMIEEAAKAEKENQEKLHAQAIAEQKAAAGQAVQSSVHPILEETREQFIERTMKELQQNGSRLSKKMLQKKAESIWNSGGGLKAGEKRTVVRTAEEILNEAIDTGNSALLSSVKIDEMKGSEHTKFFLKACRLNRTEIAKEIIPLCYSEKEAEEALYEAAKNGNDALVYFILSKYKVLSQPNTLGKVWTKIANKVDDKHHLIRKALCVLYNLPPSYNKWEPIRYFIAKREKSVVENLLMKTSTKLNDHDWDFLRETGQDSRKMISFIEKRFGK